MVSTTKAKLWGKELAKTSALCGALLLVWYSVLLLTGWYDAGFHLFATVSSAIMVKTGNSWGVIGKIVA